VGSNWNTGKGRLNPQPAARYALHRALVAAGEPHLAAVPLICFERHQRPENVLAGHLTWADYRPFERPDAVRVEHHKTGEIVWLPLRDRHGPLFPELAAYLDNLERLGVPIVLMKPRAKGATARPYHFREARRRIRRAGGGLTLAACRHGGLTELGARTRRYGSLRPQGREIRAAICGRRTGSRPWSRCRPSGQTFSASWRRGSGGPGLTRLLKRNRKGGDFQNEAPAALSE
jgi:hypothetical protein